VVLRIGFVWRNAFRHNRQVRLDPDRPEPRNRVRSGVTRAQKTALSTRIASQTASFCEDVRPSGESSRVLGLSLRVSHGLLCKTRAKVKIASRQRLSGDVAFRSFHESSHVKSSDPGERRGFSSRYYRGGVALPSWKSVTLRKSPLYPHSPYLVLHGIFRYT